MVNEPKRVNGDQEESDENSKLEIPCQVSIHRPKKFMGAINHVLVHLNGNYIDRLKNGKTINFTTDQSNNEIIIANPANNSLVDDLLNQNSVAGRKKFSAAAGGSVQFTYDYIKGSIQEI